MAPPEKCLAAVRTSEEISPSSPTPHLQGLSSIRPSPGDIAPAPSNEPHHLTGTAVMVVSTGHGDPPPPSFTSGTGLMAASVSPPMTGLFTQVLGALEQDHSNATVIVNMGAPPSPSPFSLSKLCFHLLTWPLISFLHYHLHHY